MEILSIAAAVGLFALQSAALRKVSAPTLRDNLLATGASAGMIALAFGVIWLCQGGPLAPVTAALGAAVGVGFSGDADGVPSGHAGRSPVLHRLLLLGQHGDPRGGGRRPHGASR